MKYKGNYYIQITFIVIDICERIYVSIRLKIYKYGNLVFEMKFLTPMKIYHMSKL